MGRTPNQGGKGPATTKQGKVGPILGSWTLQKGTQKSPKGGNKR